MSESLKHEYTPMSIKKRILSPLKEEEEVIEVKKMNISSPEPLQKPSFTGNPFDFDPFEDIHVYASDTIGAGESVSQELLVSKINTLVDMAQTLKSFLATFKEKFNKTKKFFLILIGRS